MLPSLATAQAPNRSFCTMIQHDGTSLAQPWRVNWTCRALRSFTPQLCFMSARAPALALMPELTHEVQKWHGVANASALITSWVCGLLAALV